MQLARGSSVSRKGFSLVEMMIVSAIGAVIAYAFLTLVSNMQLAASSIQKNLEYNSIISEIELYLSQNETCLRLFDNVKVPLPSPIPSLPYLIPNAKRVKLKKLSYSTGVVPAVSAYDVLVMGQSKNGLVPTRIEFDKLIDNTLANNGTNRRLLLNFAIDMDKAGQDIGGQKKHKDFVLLVELDPADNIVNCLNSSQSPMAICQMLGGTSYTPGDNPPCKLTAVYQ